MTGPAYTTCFAYHPPDKPFNKQRDMVPMLLNHGAAALFFGAVAGLAAGLLVGGPIGAVVGLLVGFFVGGYAAVATILHEGAQQWLHHRLVCLDGRVCAVGRIKTQPKVSDLGDLDNDEFFNLALMPYPYQQAYEVLGDPSNAPATQEARDHLARYPGNVVFEDRFQGKLIRPRDDLLTDLGYCMGADEKGDEDGTHDRAKVSRNWLHVEAEGDFWVRMDDLASALGLLGGVAAVGVAGAAVAGAVEGCAIGGLLGIIGCVIGAIIGAIVAGAIAAIAAKAAADAVLQGIFDTNPGSVEDANYGDQPLGTLNPGDAVAVYGVHVYDGFHAGWHEVHPLLRICKIGTNPDLPDAPKLQYLTWTPNFLDHAKPPEIKLPGVSLQPLTDKDMQRGLDSDLFLNWCEAIRVHWCEHLGVAADPATTTTQKRPQHRWAVHPQVDGCIPLAPPDHPHVPDPGPA